MGSSSPENEIRQLRKEINRSQFFSAYKSIKNILQVYIYPENIYNKNNKPIDVYLINSKTISDFIKTLGNVFDIEKKEELNKKEKVLKKTFEDYSIKDNNVEIFSNYEQCKEIMKNKNKNEFIIVDSNFIAKLEIKNADYKKVEINKIENKCLYIKFLSSGKIINAQEIENKKGFFEFCEKKEKQNIILKKDSINENITNVNSITKDIDLDSMIKSIFYCLIKINSLNNFFLCCGDMIKKDKEFSFLFFNLIDTYNIRGQIDYLKLSNFIKEKNKKSSILQFSFEQMHNELNNLYKNKGSIINDIFNYQYVSLCSCQNSYNNSIMEYIIKCSLKTICSHKNLNNLNIYDCFDYLFSSEYNNNNLCSKCGKNCLKKINSTNDILTIIFDLEEDTNNISLNLDFNLKLDKYFFGNSQNKYNFELIVFSSYFYEEGQFISFHKDNDKIWHCYNGSEEKQIQINEVNYKNPFLLIYKKIN